MKIIQIVGFKNSGKTTLATKMIKKLTEDGYNVGTLKHHGHGGMPIGITDTDSEKHRQAGAVFSGVEGDGLLQLSAASWDMKKILAIYRIMHIDVLIIEGFKQEPFPKIVLIQRKEEMVLLDHVENIKAIVSSLPLEETVESIPVFDMKKVDILFTWVKQEFLCE
ncbi:molybdopterin-guanine dinucleotide biosynthesis protein B [Ralstonia pickettii]|nr:molybdopterin-guanine dinucleotide biosynthesis protein B [Ralstonia pickettii]